MGNDPESLRWTGGLLAELLLTRDLQQFQLEQPGAHDIALKDLDALRSCLQALHRAVHANQPRSWNAVAQAAMVLGSIPPLEPSSGKSSNPAAPPATPQRAAALRSAPQPVQVPAAVSTPTPAASEPPARASLEPLPVLAETAPVGSSKPSPTLPFVEGDDGQPVRPGGRLEPNAAMGGTAAVSRGSASSAALPFGAESGDVVTIRETSLGLRQYAELAVLRSTEPDSWHQRLSAFGIPDRETFAALEVVWQSRIAAEPEVKRRWAESYRRASQARPTSR